MKFGFLYLFARKLNWPSSRLGANPPYDLASAKVSLVVEPGEGVDLVLPDIAHEGRSARGRFREDVDHPLGGVEHAPEGIAVPSPLLAKHNHGLLAREFDVVHEALMPFLGYIESAEADSVMQKAFLAMVRDLKAAWKRFPGTCTQSRSAR
jgi:hypothetical protein